MTLKLNREWNISFQRNNEAVKSEIRYLKLKSN